jgi:hypothetical protein
MRTNRFLSRLDHKRIVQAIKKTVADSALVAEWWAAQPLEVLPHS